MTESLALVICAALATACSSQSRNAKPVFVAQVPAAAGTSTSTTAATATRMASANEPTATGSAIDPFLIKGGHRAVKRGGNILDCQTQMVTGTNFANTVCMTADAHMEPFGLTADEIV